MYFENLILNSYKDKKIDIYVDMDGVICDYAFGNLDYLNKRPLNTNIKLFRKLSKYTNITLHILSICRKDTQIEDKNIWLNKYAPYFKKANRHIISKENTDLSSKELKCEFLKARKDDVIILIDDDNSILKHIKKELPNVILYQDSSLID